MEFADGVIVRLADPDTRSALFDAAAMESLVNATYDTEAMPVSPPFTPLFDEVRLGYVATRRATVTGEWADATGAERRELRVQVHGLADLSPLRVDALWRGAIVVRTSHALETVESVEVALPSLDVDREIAADLGALPGDPAALESERRERLLTRVRAGLDQPDAFTEQAFDRLLVGVGAASAGDLVEQLREQVQPASVQLRFSPPSGGPATPRALPFAGAVLIRDKGFSIAEALADSRMVREQVQDLGLERPVEPDVRRRQPVAVVWIVPRLAFADDGWPGGTPAMNDVQRRAARARAAAQWLAREGIALVTVD
ncbi:hypothetical protein OM076_11300 [Solirubrobacter ginsenosidimutans]|uniref:Uncharacterized protein n=1 Tax=Solirubrobacter ginsenosidimutans TaxID=490573 RepID=A0A9X3MSK2_9ACTN|nr:hypothetical protein [Solirubrobacter ginsenosidimutans]MDA0160852.1 hypothetical protein [Solirubrobacter ginsenosidimutans]